MVLPALFDMKLLFFSLGVLAIAEFVESLPANSSLASSCRNGWSYYGGACYLFVTSEKDTWIEAVVHCKILRGYLVDILDDQEDAFIKSELQRLNVPGCYYMGATDVEMNGQWIWPNTEDRAEYTNWAPTEPDQNGEHCACLSDYFHFQWADVPCHSVRHFVCKARLDSAVMSQGIIG